jgi:outer membrane receptor protein involved in Fe transport
VAGDPTEFSVDIGRRFVELGPRINEFRNKTTQVTAGARGSLFANWGYDAYISRGEASQNQILRNWGSSSKVQQALRALDPTTCIDPSNGCVPLNLFGAAGTITPAMLSFINLNSITTVDIKQDVLAASFSGDLGAAKSPFSRLPISMVVGVENRKMTAGNLSDAAAQINGEILGTGAPSPDIVGSFKLNEVYTEAIVPLVTDAPFARALNLEVGYRQSEFKTTSTTRYGSWKFGGDWSPVKGLRVRAMAQRATRAPNVGELFNPVVTGLDNLAVDPCQGTNINAAQANTPGTLSNLCLLTGVPLARFGTLPEPSAGQVNVLVGGNPALKPEEADTVTVGFVWEPEFVQGLTLALDYYKIDIDKAISSPSVADVMDDCYSAARNPGFTFNAACANVLRGPGGTFNGSSAPGIRLTQTNQGKQATSGFDFKIDYRLNLSSVGAAGWGTVDIGLNLNSVEKYWFKASPNSVQRDCLGYYSVACGAPNYKQKFSQRTAWNMGDFSVGYNWRHVSAVDVEPGSGNWFAPYRSIKAYDYVDLSASWRATKNVRLNLSVTNLFDKAPPEVGNTIGTTSTNSGNTFPQNYDVVGRYFTIGATLTF